METSETQRLTEGTPGAAGPRPEGEARQAEPYRPHPLLGWLYRRFFQHIAVDDRWSGAVREAQKRGVVVYVMRSLSFLDFVCLDFLTKRFALPLVRFVNDLGLWILEPFGKGDRRLRLRRQIPEDKALEETIEGRHSALLFLRRPPGFAQPQRKGAELEVDLIATLVAAQRTLDKPILLVPQTFVWSKLPTRKRPSLLDLVFGTPEWPGKLRVVLQFVLNYRNALLRSGEPFDLGAFVAEHPTLDDAAIADKVRYAMLRRIERERTIVLGPHKKTTTRIRDEILRSPRVRRQLEAAARGAGTEVQKVERDARRDLSRLCAAQDPHWIRLMHGLVDRLWNRIYDGLEVDEDGLGRLREAARRGPLVLIPSHKSHVDYLIVSDVMYTHALSPPLVAAGDNLAFWPLGAILRRAGAFFIKRRFQGKKLYSTLVDAYVRKVLLEGHNLEFFIEGARSRTGKLLPPKLGLLSMIVDAALALRGQTIQFVPISIGYERIIEERSYVHELSGGEKERENLGNLLRSSRVLRSKYGRLYVHIGEIVTVDDVLGELGTVRDALTPPQRRALVQRMAHRTVYEINRVTVVTPAALVATALLAHRRRGMSHEALAATASSLLDALRAMGARLASALDQRDLRGETLEVVLRLFVDGKLVVRHAGDEASPAREAIYSVPDERRIALDYYKNNVIHFFVPSALISAALCTFPDRRTSEPALRASVQRLSRLLKYEFMFRADASFDAIFDDAVAAMVARGELGRTSNADGAMIFVGEQGALVPVYAMMLRTYFEAYRLALRGAERQLSAPTTRKEWLKRTLAAGQRLYLAGEIEARESLSGSRVENAIYAMRDLGLVVTPSENDIAPSTREGASDELRAWVATLDSLLA